MPDKPEHQSEGSTSANNDLFVVGIGASAGGLSALEELFNNLSAASGAAFVVIQHLSPDFKSLMKELLERRTTMPVYRVIDGMELQPDSVYLIPPGQNLALEKNVLRLEDRKKDKNQKHELNFPIDLFLSSLAKNYGERSIGVILSGSGSDGTRGLKAINEAGGVALVQDPQTAEFDGMPVSAISTGVVNQILPPLDLSQLIYQCIIAPANIAGSESNQSHFISPGNLSSIAKLLVDEEGLDFSQYRSSTMSRRIHRRCLIHNTKSIDTYINLLNNSGKERQILCSDLLINVTHFFRDYPAWKNLENNILPRLIQQSKADTELRFWITACSTGEEAYSLAILIHEALQDFDKYIRVKIFATDIDRVALEKASQGIYPASIATDIGQERLHKYFIAKDNSYQIMRKIREMLIFSPHDLTKDAGFTRINLVTCRNVLIYMKSELQYQVLRNLHFSLVSKGVLFLGEAETLGEFEEEFEPLDKKWKFFQKRRDIRLPLPLRSIPRIGRSLNQTRFHKTQQRVQFEPVLEQCLKRISDNSNSVILMIDKDYSLLHVSGDASKIFKAPGGKITTEVIKMVVPALGLPLNTALHRAKQQGQSILYQGLKLEDQDQTLELSLEVIPPHPNRQHGDFFVVKFVQKISTESLKIPKVENFELGSEASRHIMEMENELQQTRENLQTLVEELETTNEEQQASNEELTASNEELQSTNEELHSVNEELHTVNIEYQSKISELTQLNDDIDNLLQSTEIGVIFLDSQLRIRKFTPAVTSAIALRQSDLDRPLEDLYWKFECPNLCELLNQALDTKEPQEQEVKLKQSESYLLMQIHLYQTERKEDEGLVLSFIKIDEVKQAQLKLEREVVARQRSEEQLQINQEALIITQERVENIFSSLEDAVWSFDLPTKRLGYLNTSFEKIYGKTKNEFFINDNLWLDVVHPNDKEMVQEAHQVTKQQETLDIEYRILHADGSNRWVRDRSKTIFDDYGTAIRQDFVISDLTEQRQVQQALKEREQSFQAIFNSMYQFMVVLNPEGILLEANETALTAGGLTIEEVINRPFWEARWWTSSEATQEQLKQAISQAAAGELVRYEVDILGALDQVITIDFSLKPVTNEAGQVIKLIPEGREISEIKQAREELNQSNLELEKRVQSLAQFSDRLQELHRLATFKHNNLPDLWNDYLQSGCQMLNLTTGIVSEVNNYIYKIIAIQSPLDLEVGYKASCADMYCAEVLETKTTITFAEVKKNESMQMHPVYLDLKLESFISTPIFVDGYIYGTLNFSDTKARKREFALEEIKIVELMARNIGDSIAAARAKEALETSVVKFRNTFEQAGVGVAHISPAGYFIKVNQRLCEILDYEDNILLAKTFQEITYAEDLNLGLEYLEQTLSGMIDGYSLEKRYVRSDLAIVWANLTVSLVRDDSGEPDYFIAVIEDISDRKKIELDLIQNRLKLEQANKAKDNFIAHMSHELRTPLNSVIGFSNILKKDPSLNKKQLKPINIINQSGQHLLTLINDILDLSKLDANQLELKNRNLNLAHFLGDIAAIFDIRIQDKGLNFIVDVADDLPGVVSIDITKLRQVLFNLLSNAVKFTTTGTITLSVKNSTAETHSNSKLKTIYFAVENTGPGIPKNQHDIIFAPFGQLDRSSNNATGTGLGLPICQKILGLMGSELYLDSQVNQGCRFWFDLDLIEVLNYNTLESNCFNKSKVRKLASPCKVLIVDDNEDHRFLLIDYLQTLGFTLKEANNGQEGMAIARNFKPDVILVDSIMPLMNGKEMITNIRQDQQLQDSVVLMISANVHLMQDSSANQRYDGFLTKPVYLDKLLELFEQHLQLDWKTLDKQHKVEIVLKHQDLIAPPEAILKKLLELVYCGKVKELSRQINLLESESSKYVSFVEQVRFFSNNYRLEELEELIESLVEQK